MGTQCLPARAPRTARAVLLLVPAPPREHKERPLRRPPRTCTPEGCAHTPHHGASNSHSHPQPPPRRPPREREGVGRWLGPQIAARELGRPALRVCASRRPCRGGHGTREDARADESQRREESVHTCMRARRRDLSECPVLQPPARTGDHIRNGAGEHDPLTSGVHSGGCLRRRSASSSEVTKNEDDESRSGSPYWQ
ncbi:hypothetical protein DFH09DRAFT_1279001 [Mycena vulgaris]|nr:hypothetical protein DFH09DRAFT_1279001 [Mycena vulgaris]